MYDIIIEKILNFNHLNMIFNICILYQWLQGKKQYDHTFLLHGCRSRVHVLLKACLPRFWRWLMSDARRPEAFIIVTEIKAGDGNGVWRTVLRQTLVSLIFFSNSNDLGIYFYFK